MVEVVEEEINWEKIEPNMLAIYVAVYSAEELREFGEFYLSPLGQKIVSKMPEPMEASLKITQDMVATMIPRLTELRMELRAELQKHRTNR